MTAFLRLLLLLALLVFGWSSGAHAQFAAQATYAGSAGGTANAITLNVRNWTVNRAGVPITFLPIADNTGATTINITSVGAVTVLKPSNGGLTALTGGEIRNGQLTAIVYDGTRYVLQGQLGQFTDAATYSDAALSFDMPKNLGLAASVSTNALTITLQTAAGGTPSASSPVIIPFRSSTIGSGVPEYVRITGAMSFTIASGSTMGCVSGQMCRLWIIAICSSGVSCTGSPGTDTVGLCAYNALAGSNAAGYSIAPINETALQTSGSGTAGGSSAQTYYCNISGVTARAIRIIGFVEIQQVTAGTWATGPTYVQLFGPGSKKPGDVVQMVPITTITASSAASVCPTMVSLSPAKTIALTPTSSANVLKLNTVGTLSNNSPTGVVGNIQWYWNGGLVGNPAQVSSNEIWRAMSITNVMYHKPNSTSSQTYEVRVCSTNSTMYYPGFTTPDQGILMEVIEIMSSNDNWKVDRKLA